MLFLQFFVVYRHTYRFIYSLLVGNLTGKLIWGALDDVVMGGVSESTFQVDPTGSETGGPTGLFKGFFFLSHILQLQIANAVQCRSPHIVMILLYSSRIWICFSFPLSPGVVSTSNNGGFTSIRTKVRMYGIKANSAFKFGHFKIRVITNL